MYNKVQFNIIIHFVILIVKRCKSVKNDTGDYEIHQKHKTI